ncbi:4726_t:CDS:2, partial [Dentiscutata erythropus]
MSQSDICDDFFEESSDDVSLSRRQYAKYSWVWKHFTLSKDGNFCICSVEIAALSDKKVKCGHKLLYNGGTGNMSSHLQIKHNLHEKKNKYWNKLIMIGLFASLLDPRLKTLSTWDDETQKKAKTELAYQFQELIGSDLEQAAPTSNLSNTSNNNLHHNRLHSSIFGTSATFDTTSNPLSELEYYLDPYVFVTLMIR